MDKVIVIPLKEEFTPAEVARRLGKSPQNINNRLNTGKITWFLDDEGRRRIARKDLIDYIRASMPGARVEA